jgi:hypothetical protein
MAATRSAWLWVALLLPVTAGADVDRKLSTACPPGTQPVSTGVGAACMIPQCQHDQDCPGQVCRDQPLCIRHSAVRDRFSGDVVIIEHSAGMCGANGECPRDTECVLAPRCVSLSPVADPPAASGGCTRRSGTAAMFAPLVLVRRRRRGCQAIL